MPRIDDGAEEVGNLNPSVRTERGSLNVFRRGRVNNSNNTIINNNY
jgi:hypothetical protein